MAKGHAAGPPRAPGKRFKGSLGRRDTFKTFKTFKTLKGSLVPNVAF